MAPPFMLLYIDTTVPTNTSDIHIIYTYTQYETYTSIRIEGYMLYIVYTYSQVIGNFRKTGKFYDHFIKQQKRSLQTYEMLKSS